MLLQVLPLFLVILVDARVIDIGNDGRSVCLTEECREFARRILTSMNASVDPCVDFYEYACGNWPRSHPLTDAEKNSKHIRMISANENKRKVEEMLQQELQDDEIPPVQIAKLWYQACMDTEAIDRRGMEPLVSILNEIGGWPITMARNKWNESGQPWQDIDDYYAHLRGVNLLYDVRVAKYGRNATELTIVLDVPDLPAYSWMLGEVFDRENETDAAKPNFTKIERYWNFIWKVILSMADSDFDTKTKNEVKKDVEDLLEFQWRLSKMSSLVDDYVNMTVGSLQKWYDNLGQGTENSAVNWTRNIIGSFKELGIDVSEDTLVKVTSPGYFQELVPLLEKTPKKTIVNYLHWSFVSSMIAKTTTEMKESFEKVVEVDAKSQETRSDLCIEEAKMKDVIAYEYARKYFSNDTIEMAMNVWDDIEKEMEIEIEDSNWVNEEIKELALRKIRSVKRNIAYPEWYNNATIMENYFAELKIGPTYFENSLRLQKYYKLKQLRSLKYKDPAKSWLVDPLTINAFYLRKSNSINVPLANLQKPFFSSAQPNTINYALTGYLLAHEFYHPFDEEKRLYDERGERINWPEEMTKEYYKSAQCFVEQYNNYTLDGIPSGSRIENYGNLTFDENMPDTMALKTAFKAYKRRERVNGQTESALPGLVTFNNDEIFFLSSANLWCEIRDPNRSVIEAKLDVHSTARLRAIGALSNNQDFADTFGCPLGSPMNSEKKCNIWKLPEIKIKCKDAYIVGFRSQAGSFPGGKLTLISDKSIKKKEKNKENYIKKEKENKLYTASKH